MSSGSDQLRNLLEQVQVERDSARLLELLGEVNRILEQRESGRRQHGSTSEAEPGKRRAMGTQHQSKLADAQ